ncbi:hypothetical protein K1719_001979 [Acacia pycnantha]|nr:hypothetical protein K1719_001979 [Acacia pycnantha]
MEATSLNTDELVDQQNYDVARSISSTSNFNQCKTGDPTGATEFGVVSSLNTVLVHQHNCDAANLVSCTSNFTQWEIRDPLLEWLDSHLFMLPFTIKTLKNPDNTSSLIKEIQILSQLEHPNIVKYYGAERVRNQLWLFMEYVETGTLTKYISEVGAFRASLVRDTTAQILSALAYLHNKRVVHRDIKPDNILVETAL